MNAVGIVQQQQLQRDRDREHQRELNMLTVHTTKPYPGCGILIHWNDSQESTVYYHADTYYDILPSVEAIIKAHLTDGRYYKTSVFLYRTSLNRTLMNYTVMIWEIKHCIACGFESIISFGSIRPIKFPGQNQYLITLNSLLRANKQTLWQNYRNHGGRWPRLTSKIYKIRYVMEHARYPTIDHAS